MENSIRDGERLFSLEVYYGKSKKNAKKLTFEADPISKDIDAYHSVVRCRSEEGLNEEKKVDESTEFMCLMSLIVYVHNTVDFIADDIGNNIYIKYGNDLVRHKVLDIFGGDCFIPRSIEDKVYFAESNGYKTGWEDEDTEGIIELDFDESVKISTISDFGQLQIFDGSEIEEPPMWDDSAMQSFAAVSDGAVFLGVVNNDNHEIEVSLLSQTPDIDTEYWDHVVIIPFETSGDFCFGEQEMKMPAGSYSVCWYIRRVGSSAVYKLDFWQDAQKIIEVLKKM
ncbi:MAG: hypothetical protein VW258_13530 [Thalassolituus sp.]